MAFFIRQEHYQLMIDHCLAARPNEACGLLGGRNGRGEEIFLTSNSKESPTTYEVDPEQLVVILQGLAEAGRELVAVFHSHPTGRAFPSAEDIRLAFYPEAHYVIVGLSPQVEVRAFRIVEGRVSEAEMLIEAGERFFGGGLEVVKRETETTFRREVSDENLENSAGEKLERLQQSLASLGSVLVAFSGGVDSSFLLKMALETLGKERVLAVTAASETYFPEEVEAARHLAQTLGAQHLVITTAELQNEEFASNPPDRCYFCKKHLMTGLTDLARERGLAVVVDGANRDDLADYRPGSRASRELGVRSPLQEAGLTKAEIRAFSRDRGLPTWDKPSLACLASRFPYWNRITPGELLRVGQAERFLRDLGFRQVRVRHHGQLARIEVLPEDFPALLRVAPDIHQRLKELGYIFVTMDLAGYRTGSLNEALTNTPQ